MKNCEAYSSFSSLGSDHRIVTAKIKLSLRAPRKPIQINYDWSALRDPNILQQYNVTVRNRYDALCTETESQNATEDYECFIQANKEATAQSIPKKQSRKKKRLSADPRIVSAREKVNNAFKTYSISQTNEHHELLQQEKRALQDAYDKIHEEELSSFIRKVETADTNSKHGQSWRLINEITGRKNTKQGILKGSSKEDRLKKWHDHFKALLGNEPAITNPDEEVKTIFENLEIPTGPFTMEEYEHVKKKLVAGKAAGPDGIPPEVFKLCNIDDIMLRFANNLLANSDKPAQWSTNYIKPLPKAGDLSDVGNYRGIALSAIAAKITNKMILNRIQPVLDPLLRPNQNGFRPGRSTTAHILALRRVIEKPLLSLWTSKRPLIAFIEVEC